MELTDDELNMLDDMLDDLSDKMRHYPRDYSDEDLDTHNSLRRKVYNEAKRRKLWWAR